LKRNSYIFFQKIVRVLHNGKLFTLKPKFQLQACDGTDADYV